MATYRVTGRLAYRGHPPGDLFMAELDPGERRRALRRRNIVVVDESPVRLDPRKVRPPKKG